VDEGGDRQRKREREREREEEGLAGQVRHVGRGAGLHVDSFRGDYFIYELFHLSAQRIPIGAAYFQAATIFARRRPRCRRRKPSRRCSGARGGGAGGGGGDGGNGHALIALRKHEFPPVKYITKLIASRRNCRWARSHALGRKCKPRASSGIRLRARPYVPGPPTRIVHHDAHFRCRYAKTRVVRPPFLLDAVPRKRGPCANTRSGMKIERPEPPRCGTN